MIWTYLAKRRLAWLRLYVNMRMGIGNICITLLPFDAAGSTSTSIEIADATNDYNKQPLENQLVIHFLHPSFYEANSV